MAITAWQRRIRRAEHLVGQHSFAAEILGLTEPQQQRFMQAYDIAKEVLRDLGIFPEFKDENQERLAMEIDEFERGYPRLTLTMMMDVVGACRRMVENAKEEKGEKGEKGGKREKAEKGERGEKAVKAEATPSEPASDDSPKANKGKKKS